MICDEANDQLSKRFLFGDGITEPNQGMKAGGKHHLDLWIPLISVFQDESSSREDLLIGMTSKYLPGSEKANPKSMKSSHSVFAHTMSPLHSPKESWKGALKTKSVNMTMVFRCL